MFTYQHIISAFVSARATVEMLSKAWLYMSPFILQDREYQKLAPLIQTAPFMHIYC